MKNECFLQLMDLYFEKCEFFQTRTDDNSDYNSSFQITYALNSIDKSDVKVTIDTTVSNETSSISVTLRTVGIFKLDKGDLEQETYDHLLKANTAAILFPYVRSQISLLTTQPGIKPVIIPPININALLSNSHD